MAFSSYMWMIFFNLNNHSYVPKNQREWIYMNLTSKSTWIQSRDGKMNNLPANNYRENQLGFKVVLWILYFLSWCTCTLRKGIRNTTFLSSYLEISWSMAIPSQWQGKVGFCTIFLWKCGLTEMSFSALLGENLISWQVLEHEPFLDFSLSTSLETYNNPD